MEEKDLELSQAEETPVDQTPVKPAWQAVKESWYDKINLTIKQLDIIIACGIAGLIITFIVIALDAMGVF